MFLPRNAHVVAPDLPTISENDLLKDDRTAPKVAATLEGLIAEDPFPSEDVDEDSDISGGAAGSTSQDHVQIGNHTDVAEDEGWITIPKIKVPDDWFEASDILQLRSLDRSFVFSGEKLHILVCLSATKQDEEITTPFKVAAVMSKNDSYEQIRKHNNGISGITYSVNGEMDANGKLARDAGLSDGNDQIFSAAEKMGPEEDITVTKSLLQMEGHKQKIETLLEKFKRSNFFVRISESVEPLWSKRNLAESSSTKREMEGGVLHSNDGASKNEFHNFLSAVIDQGSFDCSASGGVARETVRCYSLSSGDIVVILQVNVAVSNIKDPVLEVLQFEKYGTITPDSDNLSELHTSCGELLNWLLPLDQTVPHPLPPQLAQALPLAAQRPTTSSYAGSQIFSFGQFRSYSMPSLAQVSASPTAATYNSRPAFNLEDLDRFTLELSKHQDMGNDGLLSFRGVSLVPERFSVHCGLEGIYLPGKRWRRKLEIVQPLEIHSFAAACSTEDVLCVRIKNVSPAHLPDIIIFLDSITIIYEDASKSSPPFCLPITSIEAGNGHTLPNLPLRRGEEHSFIMKPATKLGANLKGHNDAHAMASYAILVSCRCNYTESKLFFKKKTSWRPHIAKDLMISVVSEMSKNTGGSNTGLSQLPFQVLTLHASNLTSEDLTLTVLAPLSSSSTPSLVPLSSTPRTCDFSSNTDLGCTHLWLQSTVPLGCVAAHSSSTVKLELLPLTDGIIALDTLQVAVQEKGLTYVPEQPLKIFATSSIATGIV